MGLMVRHRWPKGADAYLNWLAKPFLLFAFILYITLGLYINFFMLLVLSRDSFLVILSLSCLSYFAALIAASFFRQRPEICKVLAIETSMPNCTVTLTVARLSFSQPAGDVASTIPMAVLVVCAIPLLLEASLKKVAKFVKTKCAQPDNSNTETDLANHVMTNRKESCHLQSQLDVNYLSNMDTSLSHVSPSKSVTVEPDNNQIDNHYLNPNGMYINRYDQDTRL